MKKQAKIILGIILFLSLAVTTFYNRSFLFEVQDSDYFVDHFHHSQWAIPLSKRTISDNNLYYVAAIKLSQGEHPFTITPEVPPLGKYIYSIGILLFSNPHIVSYFIFLSIVFIAGIFSFNFTKDVNKALIVSILVSFSPSISSQVGLIMMDSLLVLFLLLHTWFIFKFESLGNKFVKLFLLILLGITLGGFISTKFPLFAPAIILADLWYFWKKRMFYAPVIIFIIAGLVFVFSYLTFFLLGHSLLEWGQSILWGIKFYAKSKLPKIPFQVVPALLVGRYWNVVSRSFLSIPEWSVLWPIFMIIFFKKGLESFKLNMPLQNKYLFLLMALYSLEITLLPFQARYLLPLIPFFIIIFVDWFNLKKIKPLFPMVLLLILVGQYFLFWRQGPTEVVKEIERNWIASQYQDLYSFINPKTISLSRGEFHSTLSVGVNEKFRLLKQNVKIKTELSLPWKNYLDGTLEMFLETPLGAIEKQYPIVFTRQNNKWYLNWDEKLFSDYLINYCDVEVNYSEAKGRLMTKDGIILSEFIPTKNLKLNVRKLEVNPEIIKEVAELTNESFVVTENLLLNEADGRDWLYLPAKMSEIDPKFEDFLNEYGSTWSGFSREVNSSIVDEKQIEKVLEIERRYPELKEKSGGKFNFSCPDGQSNIQIKGNRRDVILEEKYSDLFL